MSDIRSTENARPTNADKGLQSSQKKDKLNSKTRVPLLLIGELGYPFPQMQKVSYKDRRTQTIDPKKEPKTIQITDWRHVPGFINSLKRAINNYNFPVDIMHSEYKAVGRNDFINVIKANRGRQIIYFGHGGGTYTGLYPGDINHPIKEEDFWNAIGKDSPNPILISCYGGELANQGQYAIGFNKRIEMDFKVDSKIWPPKSQNDLVVTSAKFVIISESTIDLRPNRAPIPNVPLRNHDATAPP